ncbi:MAG: DUF938 domain-containing protein [Gammaproteobacteria bacterium]|nr:DUF938 domain-containing protein [Gammaproteobacteria bacterium]
MNKPYSQACENNKQPILAVLKQVLSNNKQLLEVGSGTGQHAVHFAEHLSDLTWQTSDVAINHAGINQWLDQAELSNLQPPLLLDLNQPWPIEQIDSIYTANTLHIVSWPLVEKFFAGVANHLASGGTLCIYGPFNYQGNYTSQSNADFDLWLKSRDPNSGIRDIEKIEQIANAAHLTLLNDYTMPANNRLLVFKRQG